MSFSPYFYIYIASIGVNAVMVIILLHKKRTLGAGALAAVLLCCSLWSFGSAMETAVSGLTDKLFWAGISYPGHTFGPAAWFVMILQLTEHHKLASRRNILLLCAISAITSVLAVTNYHGLMWSQIRLQTNGSLTVLSLAYGPWFWIHMMYATALDLLSVTVAIRFWKRQAPYFGRRYACLVFPVLIVWIVNTIYLLKLGLPVDLTPIAWGASTPFVFWALIRNNLFDLVPIARYHVMENINSAIVLTDFKNRVVDINPASAELFEHRPGNPIGMDAHELFKDWPDLLRQVDENVNQIEFMDSEKQSDNYYVSACYEIKQKENVLGRMFIIRNVTNERLIQKELLDTQRRMAVEEERGNMARDLHDDMGQILGFVNVQAQAVGEYIRRGRLDEAKKCIVRLSEVSREAHDHVRETILEMRGEAAENQFSASMYFKKLTQEFSLFERNSGISVMFDTGKIDGLQIWDSKPTMQISKIVRESFNNIRKYSEATKVFVKFAEENGSLVIKVSDNGRGFDTSTNVSGNHFGILFMRERAEEMGGRLFVNSKPGKETSVELRLPLDAVTVKKELNV